MKKFCFLAIFLISIPSEGFFKHCFSYWRLPLVKTSSISNNIWGSKGPKYPKKRPFHGCSINTKYLEILISQPHMLYKWNLPHVCLNKVFQLAKSHRVYEGVSKNNFLAPFRPFLNTSKKCTIMHQWWQLRWCIVLLAITGQKFRLLCCDQNSTQK